MNIIGLVLSVTLLLTLIGLFIWRTAVSINEDDEYRERIASEGTLRLSEILKQLGKDLSMLELNEEQQRKLRAFTGSKSIIKIQDNAINYAFADYQTISNSDYDDVFYYSNFIVKSPLAYIQKSLKYSFWHKDKWIGDKSLCNILNDDMCIKEVLKQFRSDVYINVWPEHKYIEEWPEHQGFKIATRSASVLLQPSHDLIRAIEHIAEHLKQLYYV